MRVVVNEFMSLDGVVQAPGGPEEDTDGGFAHGGWSAPYFDPEVMGAAVNEGMTTAEAQALRLKDVPLFKEYVQKVWASTDDFLAKTDPATLDTIITVKPLGEMPGIRALGQTCLSHGMSHAGEIELARTLIGVGQVIGV